MIDMRKVMEDYARLLPQDRIDTQCYMNRNTIDDLKRRFPMRDPRDDPGYPPLAAIRPATMLGMRIEMDENLPDGIIELRTETELDRAIRRANLAGRSFNIMKFEPFDALVYPTQPEPTLRALLRSYWSKIRGWGKKR